MIRKKDRSFALIFLFEIYIFSKSLFCHCCTTKKFDFFFSQVLRDNGFFDLGLSLSEGGC